MTEARDLTEPQRAELQRLVTLKLPTSYLGHGFPGLPPSNLDMRSVAALERRGLVESVIHRWRPDHATADRFTITYRATEAGRAATKDKL
jgi:hypothetical protein